ncbi:MAG: SUMF1/EgtB/PvdO family nonheme iron enzyme [Eubacteriales bacterium]|nr:SUMF1/EgtB/PvdO family nonheme iron enzyme [Eubacteriales bacterium]
MADIKVKKTKNSNSEELELEICGADYINEGMIKDLFGRTYCEKREKEDVLISIPCEHPGTEHDVVAIYDNAGIPSIMHRFRKITNKELFGGSDKTHAAFIIDGEEYDEIYISVYENCEINGKPYSLPMQKPWTGITNDDAARACFSKGDGWHLMTRAEWGLLANLSKKNGTLPHGNTSSGKYHAAPEEKGKIADGYVTLTGSGPATWTHDHTPEGVHDLCGNVWEMVRGLRIKDGHLQVAENNDAALDIDLTMEGDGWRNLTDDNGNAVRVSVDGDVTFTTSRDIEQDDGGCEWEDVSIECESEQMKELALYAGEPNAYCYIDSTDGEYLPLCGGRWYNSSSAGVFSVRLCDPRSSAYSNFGFRSAYFRKRKN